MTLPATDWADQKSEHDTNSLASSHQCRCQARLHGKGNVEHAGLYLSIVVVTSVELSPPKQTSKMQAWTRLSPPLTGVPGLPQRSSAKLSRSGEQSARETCFSSCFTWTPPP